MIFFHGTGEKHLKDIKKHGLLPLTTDQWILEVTGENICCLAKEPVAGEGGNAAFFAGRTKSRTENGYLVVIRIHRRLLLAQKLLAIIDNKTLDDYVQHHFFMREEFRLIGDKLFLALENYRQHASFDELTDKMSRRPANNHDRLIFAPTDQRDYYKKLQDPRRSRYVYQLLGLEFSDDFWQFIQTIGSWENFYQFLAFHFDSIAATTYRNFLAGVDSDLSRFWQNFYTTFPPRTDAFRQRCFQNWFSCDWLRQRFLTDISENCQIWTRAIEPEHILGCFQVTTPTGVLPEFRSQRTKSGFSRAIWKKVNRILES